MIQAVAIHGHSDCVPSFRVNFKLTTSCSGRGGAVMPPRARVQRTRVLEYHGTRLLEYVMSDSHDSEEVARVVWF